MKQILKNSYVIFVLSFIILCIIFYLLGIGYGKEIKNGKVVKKFSWKYPLAIALLIWVFWHFYLYPPANEKNMGSTFSNFFSKKENVVAPEKMIPTGGNLNSQRINMNNWY